MARSFEPITMGSPFLLSRLAARRSALAALALVGKLEARSVN